jgi:hypothetical protein
VGVARKDAHRLVEQGNPRPQRLGGNTGAPLISTEILGVNASCAGSPSLGTS